MIEARRGTFSTDTQLPETTGVGSLNQTPISANTLSVPMSRSMEALVLNYVIIKDILVSADHFIPLTPTRILNEEESLNQEINMQYK